MSKEFLVEEHVLRRDELGVNGGRGSAQFQQLLFGEWRREGREGWSFWWDSLVDKNTQTHTSISSNLELVAETGIPVSHSYHAALVVSSQ